MGVLRLSDRAEAADTTHKYAAFISYSRAVDGKLAPALKNALERFAKPWYRVRALRVFRDNDSLSANPGLWPSIQAALDTSEFFILLASPKAATSKWVRKETSYWVEHKPEANLLIAVTDGKIAWEHEVNDFDWDTTTALPESLRGKFAEEPRWIDLQWVRSEDHLEPTDGRFLDAVADLAAPLHKRPKDDLTGENVRQHRRTVRLARSAVTLLAMLLVAATAAAALFLEQRQIAVQGQLDATSRQLAGLASDVYATHPRRSMLLSAAAWRITPTAEARSAVLSSQSQMYAATLQRSGSVVNKVAFSPDGAALAAATDDGVLLWDARTRTRIAHLEGLDSRVTDLAFSPDGTLLATSDSAMGVRLWDTQSYMEIDTGEDRDPRLRLVPPLPSLAFSPDGTLLAVSDSGETRIWDVNRRVDLANIDVDTTLLPDVAFSPDGTLLAITAGEKVLLWDLGGETKAATLETDQQVRAVAFSRDGSVLVFAGSGGLEFWSVSSRTELTSHDFPYNAVSFGPDALLAAAHPQGTDLFNMTSGNLITSLGGHTSAVNDVAVSPDGAAIATAGADGTILMWTMRRLPFIRHPGSITSLDLSTDGAMVVAADNWGTAQLWDVNDRAGSVIHEGPVSGVDFSSDNTTIAIASLDGSVRLWHIPSSREIASFGVKDDFNNSVDEAALSPDGAILAAASGRTVRLWDVTNHKEIAALELEENGIVRDMGFSPDGIILATASREVVELWDVRSRSRTSILEGHTDQINGVAFSPDGTLLASAGSDGTVRLWDVRQTAVVAVLEGHTDRVNDVAFSPDGTTLASVGDDEAIRLWDVQDRRETLTLQGHDGDFVQVVFGPDGSTIAAAGANATVRLWDLNTDRVLGRVCDQIQDELTRKEWERFIPDLPYRHVCA